MIINIIISKNLFVWPAVDSRVWPEGMQCGQKLPEEWPVVELPKKRAIQWENFIYFSRLFWASCSGELNSNIEILDIKWTLQS
jgi:hypothetical protein